MKSIEEIMEMLDLFYALKHYFDRLTAQEYRREGTNPTHPTHQTC